VHSPPCPEDRLATLWMPLESARLTWHGIELRPEVTTELAWLAEDAGRALTARRQAREATARQARADQAPVVARSSAITNADTADKYRQLLRVHKNATTPAGMWRYTADAAPPQLSRSQLMRPIRDRRPGGFDGPCRPGRATVSGRQGY
jgi:hypothetical protein